MRLAPPGLDPLDAVVDYLNPYFIGLRTDDGLYRFFGRNAWGWPIGLGHHLFADDVNQEKTEQAWRGVAGRGVRLVSWALDRSFVGVSAENSSELGKRSQRRLLVDSL